jgi:hypothetical protein
MDMRQVSKAKLDAFYIAARELAVSWDDSLNDGYPFDQSFDELLASIGQWKTVVEKGWPVKAVMLSYQAPRKRQWDYVLLLMEGFQIRKAFSTFDVRNLGSFEFRHKTYWGYLSLENAEQVITGSFHPIHDLSLLAKTLVDLAV